MDSSLSMPIREVDVHMGGADLADAELGPGADGGFAGVEEVDADDRLREGRKAIELAAAREAELTADLSRREAALTASREGFEELRRALGGGEPEPDELLQHEIDHLNGVLFIDHLSRLKRSMVVRKFTKMARQQRESA